jgi:cation diffusion facilitator family transporter
MSAPSSDRPPRDSLTRYAWMSIGAAVITIALKSSAYVLTGSVGLLSDALESIVNLVAAIVALFALRFAAHPPDAEHPHGHDKVEYFSSGLEGALIFVAALTIIASAIPRFLSPIELTDVGIGLLVSVAASGINLVAARVLIRAGKKHTSITLEADGHHLMTDVWTSVGVLVGVGAVKLTGENRLDPLVAVAVALHILWAGWKLVRRSASGLLDTSLPPEELEAIEAKLAPFRTDHVTWHALKTRQSGSRRFISLHVLVPGDWSIQRGHNLVERMETAIRETGPRTVVMTHLEPIEDKRAYEPPDA